MTVEAKLGEDKVDVGADERAITTHAVSADGTGAGLEPSDLCLSLFEDDLVAFLKHLVNENERLESLNFITQDRLDAEASPDGLRRAVVPGVNNALADVLLLWGGFVIAGSLFDMNGELRFGLVAVDRPRGEVIIETRHLCYSSSDVG